jgi:hypothetical protein
MANLLNVRAYINDIETAESAAASSGTIQKIGQALNHNTDKQHVVFEWCVNGNYANLGLPRLAMDLPKHVYRSFVIDGFGFSVVTAGSGGSLEIDIIRRPTSGPTSSIWSTKPVIPAASGNNARMIYRVADSTTLVQTGGTTLGVLSASSISAGEQLEMNVTAVQSGTPYDFVFRLFGRVS